MKDPASYPGCDHGISRHGEGQGPPLNKLLTPTLHLHSKVRAQKMLSSIITSIKLSFNATAPFALL